MRCQDTYLCTKNRHRVYYVENPVDNHFSLWITLYHIVFNTTSLLVYSVRCPSVDRGAVLSGRGAVAQHDGKNLFCALFLIFSKNFSALKTSVFACFHLFCEPLRARAFSLSLKKLPPKIFFEKSVDTVRTGCYTVSTVKERHPSGRLDRDGAHRIGRGVGRPV